MFLSWERPHTTPGIYTFLGLATLPRFQTKARLLPREMIERIARFAHRDTYLAAWDTDARRRNSPDVIDITRIDEEDVTRVHGDGRQIRRGYDICCVVWHALA